MQALGFEPRPPERLQPECSALDQLGHACFLFCPVSELHHVAACALGRTHKENQDRNSAGTATQKHTPAWCLVHSLFGKVLVVCLICVALCGLRRLPKENQRLPGFLLPLRASAWPPATMTSDGMACISSVSGTACMRRRSCAVQSLCAKKMLSALWTALRHFMRPGVIFTLYLKFFSASYGAHTGTAYKSTSSGFGNPVSRSSSLLAFPFPCLSFMLPGLRPHFHPLRPHLLLLLVLL